jgi:predicted small secreted protein
LEVVAAIVSTLPV